MAVLTAIRGATISIDRQHAPLTCYSSVFRLRKRGLKVVEYQEKEEQEEYEE